MILKYHRIPPKEYDILLNRIEAGGMVDFAYVINRLNHFQVVTGGLCAICPTSIKFVKNDVKKYLNENRPKQTK